MANTDKKKVSSFVKMRQANAKYCDSANDTNKKRLDSAIEKYIDDAVKGGKTKTEAKDNVKKFTGCSTKKKK